WKYRSHFSKRTDIDSCAPCFLQTLHQTWLCWCFGACGSHDWPAPAEISSLVSMLDTTDRCLPGRTDDKGNRIRQGQDTFSGRRRKSRRRPRTLGSSPTTARPV